MNYIIGIDGGGSKTEVALFREEDLHKPWKTGYGKGSNPRAIGYEQSTSRIVSIVEEVMKENRIRPEEIKGIGAGIAGAGRSQEKEEMRRRLTSLFLKGLISENSNITVTSDSEIALWGALPPGTSSGMLIISGTGSNAIAVKDGVFHRSGGWGHLFGDEGSGYDIGQAVLRRVVKEKDGRAPSSPLPELLLNELGLSRVEEVVEYFYGAEDQKREIAALARPVLLHEHLAEVREILEHSTEELVLHIQSLHKKIASERRDLPIFTAGAIFEHSRFLKDTFQRKIELGGFGYVKEAYSSPVAGAAKLAEGRGDGWKKKT